LSPFPPPPITFNMSAPEENEPEEESYMADFLAVERDNGSTIQVCNAFNEALSRLETERAKARKINDVLVTIETGNGLTGEFLDALDEHHTLAIERTKTQEYMDSIVKTLRNMLTRARFMYPEFFQSENDV